MKKRSVGTALLGSIVAGVLLLTANCSRQPSKSMEAAHAGIACADEIAASAGLRVLKQGGNAVDALITTATVLAVTYPQAGNLGGGGFVLYRLSHGTVSALDFRETAPAAATEKMYWQEDGSADTEASTIGARACGIPGTVRGLYLLHRRYGSLPWKTLLQPAITLAREGFPVGERLAGLLAEKQPNFQRFPESARIFCPDGRPPRKGEILRQADLARSLELLAEKGDSAFYDGPIGDQIVRSVVSHGGLFSRDDFRSYRAVDRQPVSIAYRRYTIYSMPPPSSGGLVLQGMLNSLQALDLAANYRPNSGDYMALVSEIEKHWYAARNLYLGDPDFVKVPAELFASVDEARRISEICQSLTPLNARQMREYRLAIGPAYESAQTTHVSILDEDGNAVAMTYTLNGLFGSYLVAEGTGILLNNEMDDFSIQPGHPNMYGLVQGSANAIAPGKRMLSSMTPTIVERDGELVGALGTPGGSTIITTVLQVLLNKIDFQMTLQEALAAGRFHQQWLPDSIFYEEGLFPAATVGELEVRGFHLVSRKQIADIQAFWRQGKVWEVAADPRGSGVALGY